MSRKVDRQYRRHRHFLGNTRPRIRSDTIISTENRGTRLVSFFKTLSNGTELDTSDFTQAFRRLIFGAGRQSRNLASMLLMVNGARRQSVLSAVPRYCSNRYRKIVENSS